MRNKTLAVAVAAALMTSGAAMAQEKGPGTGVTPEGASTGEAIAGGELPGIVCSTAGDAAATNCSAAIADGSGGVPGTPTVSTMTLERCEGAITDVNVGIAATHTWVGDLTFTVTGPDSTAVTIIDRPGVPASTFGCSGNDIFAVLDDAAASPVETECAAGVPTINGVFSPNNALSAFNGLDANGTWTLTATDSAGGDTGSLDDWSLEIAPAGCEAFMERPPRATFGVQKVFADLNPMPVQVTLSCNTGLPLTQTTTLNPDPSGNTYVEFVVRDFADGELDCEVTESVPAGYFPVYVWAEEGDVFDGEEGCFFENVAHGDFADTTEGQEDNFCIIVNVPEVSTVTVNKEWIDENPQFNAQNFAEATWFCNNLPDFVGEIILPPLGQSPVLSSLVGGNSDSGNLVFLGNPGVDSFEIFGNWDGGTMCSVTEQIGETGVEADSSDCDSIVVFPGEDAECTIVNTRLYEGIPTLSQYGLGLLALLMLGMGFVAFRRIV